MRIFIAGTSGAIGCLVPQLVTGGHEVVGTTRSAGLSHVVDGVTP